MLNPMHVPADSPLRPLCEGAVFGLCPLTVSDQQSVTQALITSTAWRRHNLSCTVPGEVWLFEV